MKKLASLLLIILYATASSGASFHFHFCMGKFQSIGFAAAQKQACDKCGMKKGNNGCCSDVVKTFKGFTDQVTSPISFDFSQHTYTPAISGAPFSQAALLTRERPLFFATGPPEPLLPLYIRDCTFRI